MNQNNILDHPDQTPTDIKKALSAAGFKKHYAKENNTVIVQESEVVQVVVHLINGLPKVKTKFPQIGNPIQIASTIVLLVLLFYWGLQSTLLVWFLAIAGGQVISYGWYMPKINQLKKQVEAVL